MFVYLTGYLEKFAFIIGFTFGFLLIFIYDIMLIMLQFIVLDMYMESIDSTRSLKVKETVRSYICESPDNTKKDLLKHSLVIGFILGPFLILKYYYGG